MPAPIKILSSMATQALLADLVAAFAQRCKQSIVTESVGGVDAAKRVQSGEAVDIVVLAANAINKLESEGHIVAGSRADLVKSGVAIAVRAGAARPDISSESAVKQAVLAARSISFSTGPSGVHLAQVFERWGIAETIKGRTVQAPPGVPVGSLVASGEVELGFQQLSELMFLQGLDVLGPLPGAMQIITTFSAGLSVTSTQAAAAQELIGFMTSTQAKAAKRKNGMEPP